MGGTAGRVGLGLATGGASELDRAGIGFTAGATGKPGASKGGAKNGGGAPATPDFTGAAQEQAKLSHNDVNGTFGGASWAQGPDGRWTMTASMSPELRAAAENAIGRMQNQPDAGAVRDQAIDSAYRMQTSRLDPQYAQRQQATETQLANEGYSRGDAGWNQAMDNFGRERNDAYQQALLGAQSGAGNTAYAQSLAAAMQPYQQAAAIQGIGEGMGRQALAGAQAPDLMSALSAQYGGDLQRYGIQQQNKNSMLSGMGGMGTLLLGGGRLNGNMLPTGALGPVAGGVEPGMYPGYT